MDDFASYQRKNQGNATGEGFVDWQGEVNRLAAQFEGKGEGALIKEIFARAVEGKRAGTLTNAEIDLFYRQFAPTLDPVRRKKLQKLVQQLKEM